MKTLIKVAVCGTVLWTTCAVAAEGKDWSRYYYEIDYSSMMVKASNANGSGTADSPALTLAVGTNVLHHEIADINIELVGMVGLDDKTAFSYDDGKRIRAGLNAAIGVQAKAHRNFNDQFAGFVKLGVMNVTADVTNESCVISSNCVAIAPVESATNTGLTFGLGAEYLMTKSSAITLSYSNIMRSKAAGYSKVDLSSINVGFRSQF